MDAPWPPSPIPCVLAEARVRQDPLSDASAFDSASAARMWRCRVPAGVVWPITIAEADERDAEGVQFLDESSPDAGGCAPADRGRGDDPCPG